MNGLVVFLTSSPFDRVVERMRRVLRVRTAFEPTRASAQQLQLAYEQVVETMRRTLNREGDSGGECPNVEVVNCDDMLIKECEA